MKIIQLNSWQGRLLPQIKSFLEQEQPDIVCMQEVYSSSFATPLFDFLASLEQIQSVFPGYESYFSPCYHVSMLGSKVGFGNAILSRFPLREKQTTFISGGYRAYDTLDDYIPNTRTLQEAVVSMPDGQTFTVFNHHGYWDISPLGNDTSRQKMELVAERVRQSQRPVILCGDLNLKPESPAMQPLQTLLQDLTGKYQLPTTLSQFGKAVNVACDHICVSTEIDVQRFAAADNLVSDHMALILECSLKG